MYEYACKLDRVVDGDTVDVWIDLGFHVSIHRRVRLYGINAPEIRGLTAPQGQRSAAALYEFLKVGPIIIHTQLDETDKYGRVLGNFFVGAVNVNKVMVDTGFAVEASY